MRLTVITAGRRGVAGAPSGHTDEMEISRRERFLQLSRIYALHTAPLETLGEDPRRQHDPDLAALKVRLEDDWLAELDQAIADDELNPALGGRAATDDVVATMRRLAARDRLPEIYRWLAEEADRDQLVRFLAVEGGPDAGFDDLVSACQLGLRGAAKVALAVNYWDEMGHGDPAAVHTVLHDRLVRALDIDEVPAADQPESALARTAFCGLLATNRWLQPEMLGALGLVELQAGPRCRLVLHAFDRLQVPAEAYPFYEVHAEVDPTHGKDWLEKAIAPYIDEHPHWAARVLRGALWRSAVNAAFLDDVSADLMPAQQRAA
jgi:hypothetical protein